MTEQPTTTPTFQDVRSAALRNGFPVPESPVEPGVVRSVTAYAFPANSGPERSASLRSRDAAPDLVAIGQNNCPVIDRAALEYVVLRRGPRGEWTTTTVEDRAVPGRRVYLAPTSGASVGAIHDYVRVTVWAPPSSPGAEPTEVTFGLNMKGVQGFLAAAAERYGVATPEAPATSARRGYAAVLA